MGAVPSDVSSGVGPPEPGDDRSNMMKPSSISSPTPKSVPGPPPLKGQGLRGVLPIPGSNQQRPQTSGVSLDKRMSHHSPQEIWVTLSLLLSNQSIIL